MKEVKKVSITFDIHYTDGTTDKDEFAKFTEEAKAAIKAGNYMELVDMAERGRLMIKKIKKKVEEAQQSQQVFKSGSVSNYPRLEAINKGENVLTKKDLKSAIFMRPINDLVTDPEKLVRKDSKLRKCDNPEMTHKPSGITGTLQKETPMHYVVLVREDNGILREFFAPKQEFVFVEERKPEKQAPEDLQQMFFAMIQDELERQNKKWGYDRNMHPVEWQNVLTEEVGEVAKEINDSNFSAIVGKNYVAEVVQIAACAFRMYEQEVKNSKL